MKKFRALLAAIMLIMSAPYTSAQVADSVDITHYDISLDLSNGSPFAGNAVLTLELQRPLDYISLQLMGTVNAITINGSPTGTTDISQIPVSGIQPHTPVTLGIQYTGHNYVESYGWGGFHFDNDMTYNLGVAFNEDPHAIGRAMFPCRDNFTDKALYTLRIKTRAGWTAECSGLKGNCETDSLGCEHSVWQLDHPTPTYLVSVSQANFRKIHTTAAGYPLTLGFTTQDSSMVAQTFLQLNTIVPMFERCFGPYRWDRIGYIATRKGSMEHVNNIALSREFMASPMSQHGRITIPHELAHAWFGNLVTCSTEGDMWFNEGGASFCSEVAREATDGREASNLFYQENLENVIRTTHITDRGYYPLSPMPHSLTYGSTTYDKGALVWHSLRGYLGDSLFYAAITRLMYEKAFGNVSAAEVRDSLSNYTGTDLAGFFDFHVFSPGFVDYHLDLFGDTLHIRQQSIGTTATSRSNRVPVTFLSSDGRAEKRWFAFSGTDTTVLLAGLPFTPAYCILDRDCEISDAATRDEVTIIADVQRTFNHAHFALSAYGVGRPSTVCVEHHWGRPYGLDTVEGVIRTAGRYWVVNGDFDYPTGISGRFGYSRTNNLDDGFYELADELNSIVLMHRYDSRSPWQCVSRRHTSNADGYFNCILLPGEYTLAMVDTAVVAIPEVETIPLTLFPNPLKQGEALTINAPVNGRYNVTIVDSAGRRVWRKKGCSNGRSLHPDLPAGSYLVIIENNYVSLQSKLIQL